MRSPAPCRGPSQSGTQNDNQRPVRTRKGITRSLKQSTEKRWSEFILRGARNLTATFAWDSVKEVSP